MQCLIPVVMSGIIAVYSLVISVLIVEDMHPPPEAYSLYSGFMHLACGLSVGMTGLAAGYCIGVVGDKARDRTDITYHWDDCSQTVSERNPPPDLRPTPSPYDRC